MPVTEIINLTLAYTVLHPFFTRYEYVIKNDVSVLLLQKKNMVSTCPFLLLCRCCSLLRGNLMCRLRVIDCNRDNREVQKQTATVGLIDGLDIRGMGLAAPLGFSCGTF